jgi:hypothetical protein
MQIVSNVTTISVNAVGESKKESKFYTKIFKIDFPELLMICLISGGSSDRISISLEFLF